VIDITGIRDRHHWNRRSTSLESVIDITGIGDRIGPEYAPSLADVERCVDVGYFMLKMYGDGLAKNLMGFGNPEADIKEIESE